MSKAERKSQQPYLPSFAPKEKPKAHFYNVLPKTLFYTGPKGIPESIIGGIIPERMRVQQLDVQTHEGVVSLFVEVKTGNFRGQRFWIAKSLGGKGWFGAEKERPRIKRG